MVADRSTECIFLVKFLVTVMVVDQSAECVGEYQQTDKTDFDEVWVTDSILNK